MKSFSTIPPDGTIATNDMNWRSFIQNTKTTSFNPVPASGGPTFTGTILGWYAQIGPICVFTIVNSGTITSWGNSKQLLLPFTVASSPSVNLTASWPLRQLTVTTPAGWLTVTASVLLNDTASTYTTSGNSSVTGFYFIK